MGPSRLAVVAAPLLVLVAGLGVAPSLEVQAEQERRTTLFRFADPDITEASGLVAVGDRFVTVNDSGDDPVVYLVDGDGRTVGRTTFTTDEVEDVEALAVGPDGALWVGDIGDNYRERSSVVVYRMPAPEPGDRTVEAERFELAYAEGARDAETLLVDPRSGRLLVVSKGLFGGTVFAAPAELAPTGNMLRAVAPTGGLVTDGTFLPDGRYLVLRDYGGATVYDARRLRPRVSFRLPDQAQGEAITATGPDRVVVTSEGLGARVVQVLLPPRVLRVVAPPSPSPSATPAPPSAGPADPLPEADEPGTEPTAVDAAEVVALAAVVLAFALGIRVVVRRVLRRRTE